MILNAYFYLKNRKRWGMIVSSENETFYVTEKQAIRNKEKGYGRHKTAVV